MPARIILLLTVPNGGMDEVSPTPLQVASVKSPFMIDVKADKRYCEKRQPVCYSSF